SVRPSTEVSTYFDFRNESTGRVLNDGHFYFYDDYNNEGIFAHSVDSATGYVIFEGKSDLVQKISGSAPSDFANVLFNKAGEDYSFNLTNEILVNHLVDFYEGRSEEHTSELQSRENLVCRLLLEKKKIITNKSIT